VVGATEILPSLHLSLPIWVMLNHVDGWQQGSPENATSALQCRKRPSWMWQERDNTSKLLRNTQRLKEWFVYCWCLSESLGYAVGTNITSTSNRVDPARIPTNRVWQCGCAIVVESMKRAKSIRWCRQFFVFIFWNEADLLQQELDRLSGCHWKKTLRENKKLRTLQLVEDWYLMHPGAQINQRSKDPKERKLARFLKNSKARQQRHVMIAEIQDFDNRASIIHSPTATIIDSEDKNHSRDADYHLAFVGEDATDPYPELPSFPDC
jgi:hypothetical protein